MAEAQGIDGDDRSVCAGSAVFDELYSAIRGQAALILDDPAKL